MYLIKNIFYFIIVKHTYLIMRLLPRQLRQEECGMKSMSSSVSRMIVLNVLLILKTKRPRIYLSI